MKIFRRKKKVNPIDLIIGSVPALYLRGPGIGSALLKAILQENGFTVKCVDLNLELFHFLSKDKTFFLPDKVDYFLDFEKFESFYKSNISPFVKQWAQEFASSSPKWIGFFVHCRRTSRMAYKLCHEIKQLVPKQKIVLGGPESLYLGPKLKENNLCDAWIIGEAEEAIIKLLNGETNFPGINGGRAPYFKDFAQLPFPDYSDFDFSRYPSNAYDLSNSSLGLNSLYIEGSRGCIKKCSFCNSKEIWGNFRFKTGKRIFEEVINLYEKYKITHFHFTDNLVNGHLKEIKEFAILLANSYYKNIPQFTWEAHAIIQPKNRVADDFFEALKKSGCRQLKIGLESGSEKVRTEMNKLFSNEDLFHTLNMCLKYKIRLRLMLMVGFPTETESDFQKTLELITQLQKYREIIDVISAGTTLQISPTSELYHLSEELGIKIHKPNPYIMPWTYKTNTLKIRLIRQKRLVDHIRSIGLPLEDTFNTQWKNLAAMEGII